MAALLTSEKDNTDKIVEYVNETKKDGHRGSAAGRKRVRGYFYGYRRKEHPFRPNRGKNVGQGSIESILRARDTHGKFKSLEDFCENIDLRLVNRKVIESLIKAGAMDLFGLYRPSLC